MRAGTRMSGRASAGISQMQSPARRTRAARSLAGVIRSGVDDDPRAPRVADAIERELMQRHRLGVGAESGVLAIEGPAPQTRDQPVGSAPAHLRVRLGEHLAVAVL